MSFDEEGDHYMSKSDFAQMCDEIKKLTSENAELRKLLEESKVPEGWRHIRMTNMPHPREDGMRVIGWVIPVEQTEPLGMVSEAIERILLSAATAKGIKP